MTRIAETRGMASRSMRSTRPRGSLVRWQAERCIVALPVFIAARVVENAARAAARSAAAQLRYAPWLVANVHLRAPLADRPGAAPSWDNVVYGSARAGLCRCRATRASTRRRGATVLTWYRPLGPSAATGRWPAPAAGAALDAPGATSCWPNCRCRIPTSRAKATRIDITRYGHAMAIPVPGLRWRGCGAPARVQAGRLAFAHGDWSGYSIFEEAFTRGHLAAA